MRWKFAPWGMIWAMMGGWVLAEETFPEPPMVEAVYVETPPVIDGQLDDPCWAQAFPAEAFYYVDRNRPATHETHAYLCVDRRRLYVAFRAVDDPTHIAAYQTKRGGGMRTDDRVMVLLDPTCRQQETYRFSVNPLGTQAEELPSSGGSNVAWRGQWEAAARIGADGWVAELAIPFAILKYPRGQTVFGLALCRHSERDEENDYWPPMRDRFDPRQMARLTGLSLQTLERRPVLLPYLITQAEEEGLKLVAGLDAKHTFASGLTGALTLRPDFRNVEDVVETIAFSDVERYYDDPRPFFSEGANYFAPRRALHTRRIGEVDAGLKGFGEMKAHSVGVLGILSPDERRDVALNYGYSLDSFSRAKAALVQRSEPERENTVWALTASHFRPVGPGSFSLEGQFYRSRTRGEEGNGTAYSLNLGRSGGLGKLSVNAEYDAVEPTFKALDGYVPENDQRGGGLRISQYDQPETGRVQSWWWNVAWDDYQRHDGSLLRRSLSASASWRLRDKTRYSLRWNRQHRPPNRDRTLSLTWNWNGQSLYESGGWDLTFGHRGGARYLFTSLTQGWELNGHAQVSLRWEYARQNFFDEQPTHTRTQTVLTGNYDFSAERSLSARLIERNGQCNVFLAWRVVPLDGRGLYLFLGDPNATETQARLQAKVLWPF